MGSGLASKLYCVEPRNKAPLQRFRLCSTVVRPFLRKSRNLPRIPTSFPFIEPTGHIQQFIDIRQSILRRSVQILLQFLSITQPLPARTGFREKASLVEPLHSSPRITSIWDGLQDFRSGKQYNLLSDQMWILTLNDQIYQMRGSSTRIDLKFLSNNTSATKFCLSESQEE